MSTKANPKIIGAFVLGAVALAVAGVLIFGSGKFFTKTRKYVTVFEGSVKGLNIGAPVSFRGVNLGSVTNISAIYDTRTGNIQIEVEIEIEKGVAKQVGGKPGLTGLSDIETLKFLVEERGMRATLAMQSLVTGLLYVNLDYKPNTPIKRAAIESKYPEIPTIPSAIDELFKTIEDLPIEAIVQEALAAIKGIEKLVNSPKALASISSLNQTLNDIQQLVKNVDAQVAPLASGAEQTMHDIQKVLRNADGKIVGLVADMEETSKAARDALLQVEKTLVTIDGMAAEESPLRYELANAFKELSAAAHAVRILVEYLEQKPDALLRGKVRPGGK